MSIEGSLEKTTVLDFTRLIPGAYATSMLQGLGAEIIKIEQPGGGDYLRWIGPFWQDVEKSRSGAMFLCLNAGKKSICLDLKNPKGIEIIKRLVVKTDVVVDSFRPGVMEKLGLNYEELKKIRSDLIYCSITGYGQGGELADRAGHDLNYLAKSGYLALSSEGGQPHQLPITIADLVGGGLNSVIQIMAAFLERQKTGEGAFIDVSMLDGVVSLLSLPIAEHLASGEIAKVNSHLLTGGAVCYRPYRCLDGWVVLAALEYKFWNNFCRAIDRTDLLEHQFDSFNSPTYMQLEELFANRDLKYWRQFSQEVECCLDVVEDFADVVNSGAIQANVTNLKLDDQTVRVFNPFRGAGKDSRVPPILGQDSQTVLESIGFDEAEIQQMAREEVIQLG